MEVSKGVVSQQSAAPLAEFALCDASGATPSTTEEDDDQELGNGVEVDGVIRVG